MEPTEQPAVEPWIPSEEQYLFLFLKDRDVFCPLCKYNLRNSTVPRCPECGREFRLAIGLTEPFLRAWICLAFVVFSSSGIGLAFWYGFTESGFRHIRPLLLFPVLYISGTPLLAIAVIRWRRRFIRLSKQSQWWLVALAFFLSAVSFGIIFEFG